MEAAILALLTLAEGQLGAAIAVFLRVGAVMAVLPGFGEQGVPQRVRLGLTAMLTVLIFPAVSPQIGATLSAGTSLPWLALVEVVSGLLLGLGLRMFVLILQTAGTKAAQATSLSQILGGTAAPDPLPAFGNIFVMAGLALAMLSGLHVKVVVALILSYQILPPGILPLGSDVFVWGAGHVARAFGIAFTLAAPFLILSVLYNVAMGAINKAMPQLMVAFVGAPAITGLGMILLAICVPLLLPVWLAQFDGFLARPMVVVP